MINPVLVEVLRGETVESRHSGSVFVCDADGATVMEIGDPSVPVFPRSAVKAIQALPLVETGAADAYGFGVKELALACASHNGQIEHTSLALSMLNRAGLDEAALECGAHWPSHLPATVDLARSGASPSDLHNNCSGKHAGFICACCQASVTPRGYVNQGHWLQEAVREALETVTGAAHRGTNAGTDGCAIPTYAVPLRSLALGFARMATGSGLGPERAKAARRLLAACTAEPFFVAGTGRADTVMMQAAGGRIFTKTGAEGVFCAAIPEQGIGIALKCEDGGGRAAEAMIAAVLARLLGGKDALSARFAELANPILKNWNGTTVGSLRPTAGLA